MKKLDLKIIDPKSLKFQTGKTKNLETEFPIIPWNYLEPK
jgi:hypothetical protein